MSFWADVIAIAPGSYPMQSSRACRSGKSVRRVGASGDGGWTAVSEGRSKMSKLGLVCVLGLALAGVACGGDEEPKKTKCEVQTERAMTECNATVPMLGGDPAMCTGTSLCVAGCAETASCEDITAASQFQGPLVACTINCFTGGTGDDPLCDQQVMRVQTECQDGGMTVDAGLPPIDVPCNGSAKCLADCTAAATCAEIVGNAASYTTCTQACVSGS